MKKLILFFSCFPVLLHAQQIFDFEDPVDERWKQFPAGRWDITSEHPISGNFSLQHIYDNPGSGCDLIATDLDQPDLSDTIWFTFRIRHGYNPSSANNWQVSFFNNGDSMGLSVGEVTDGIYFGVNLTGSDDLIKIWQVSDGDIRELLNTTVNYQETVGTDLAPFFKLIRIPTGQWEMFYNLKGNDDSLKYAGLSRVDAVHGGRLLLVRYTYSSSQDRKLWLDDLGIRGRFYADTLPPMVLEVTAIDMNRLNIEFSEPVLSTDFTQFLLSGTIAPKGIEMSGHLVRLTYNENFANRVPISISLAGISDGSNNVMADTVVQFLTNYPEWGDMVINEIMVDPNPPVYLPDCEYVELFNRSDWDLSVNGWQLAVNDRRFDLGDDTIYPGGYLVLTGKSCASFYSFTDISPILSSSSVLSNSGGEIILYDQFDRPVHMIRYALPVGPDSWKREGGWAIEQVDPDLLCGSFENMAYSKDPAGGTPGSTNSIAGKLEDQTSPVILYLGTDGERMIRIHFSELIDAGSIDLQTIRLGPERIIPDSMVFGHLWEDRIDLYFPESKLDQGEKLLSIGTIEDCTGNRTEESHCPVALPAMPEQGALLISEVMYDPEEGMPEFIELYNHSKNFLDLRDFRIGLSEIAGIPGNIYFITGESYLLASGSFLVITPDRVSLMQHYELQESGRLMEPDGMPALVNTGGYIYLYNRSGQVIDYMLYRDDMHLSILDNTKGISLERISYERPGNAKDNWHSAASGYRYATPGEKNSQSEIESPAEGVLELFPEVFSPDNDGMDDVMVIIVNPGTHGFILRMDVIDASGNRLRELCNNDLLAPENRYYWDGRLDSGSMSPEGLYILHALLYNPDTGKQFRIRKAFALVYR